MKNLICLSLVLLYLYQPNLIYPFGFLIHNNVIHLCMNILALWIVDELEETQSPLSFLFCYMTSGVATLIFHYSLYPEIVMYGSSGAIYCILVMHLILNKKILDIKPISSTFESVLFLCALEITLMIVFKFPIAHHVHIGGIFLGITYSFIIKFIDAKKI